MKIRRAEPTDARGILEMHRRAVRAFGADDYDEEVLEAWSPPVDDERIEGFCESSFGEESDAIVFVAVEGSDEDERVLGFSGVVPSDEKLRAVYVDPEFARRGLGKSLLRQAEWAAAQNGAERLRLDSSLNAVGFYEGQGYERLEVGSFRPAEGVEMQCVHMEKELPGPGL